jgi:hypothetical protein
MHAMGMKRRNLNQVVGLALVLGLAASLALNVVMLSQSDERGSTGAVSQASVAQLAMQRRYYDLKTARLDTMDAAIGAQYGATAQASSCDGFVSMYYDQMERAWLPNPTQIQRQQLMDRADCTAWQRSP